MAYIQKRVSDLSGTEAAESEFTELVIRESPWTSATVKLDVLAEEIKNLKSAGQLVVLEVKAPGEDVRRLICTVTEFKKLHEDIENIVQNARGVRGRAPGYSPKNGS